MSIVIALIIVLVVGGLIVNFYPKPNKPTLAQGEILTPDETVESITEEAPTPETLSYDFTPRIMDELVDVVIPTTPPSTPIMKAKKKPHHKKKPAKAKTNA